MLTASKIKVIYCYLMCFFMTLIVVFWTASLTRDYITLKNFETTYIPSPDLAEHVFSFKKRYQNMAPDKIEQLRQQAIKEDKERIRSGLEKNLLTDWPYIIYALLILGVHIIIIKRTKES